MITAVSFAARELPTRGWGAIQRRLVRLLGVYAFWTAAYLLWASSLRSGYWASVTTGTLKTLQTFLLGGAWFHLYFLPALIQLLLVLPAIALIARRPSWAWAALAATTAVLVLGDFAGRGSPLIGWLHHQWVLVWLPEGIAGAALAARTISCRRPWLWVGSGLAILVVESQLSLVHNTPSVTAYARAGLPIAAIGLVGLAERLKAAPALLVRLGRQSLGVYLVHMVVLHYAVKALPATHASLLEQAAVALATVGLSLAVVEIVDRTLASVIFGRTWRRVPRIAAGRDEIRLVVAHGEGLVVPGLR